jgi:hypothetical protein
MKRPERRTFLRNTGLAITAAALSEPLAPAGAQTSNAAPPNQAAEAPGPDLPEAQKLLAHSGK